MRTVYREFAVRVRVHKEIDDSESAKEQFTPEEVVDSFSERLDSIEDGLTFQVVDHPLGSVTEVRNS